MFNFKLPSNIKIDAHIVLEDKRKKFKFTWFPKSIFFFNNQTKIGGSIIMVSAKISQKFTLEWPKPKDKGGNDAVVQDGSVKFISDDEALATVEPDPDHAPYGCIVHTLLKV